ncbi:MAG: hypothetical protein P8Z70_02270 [Desulfuromonadales bacterium]|jgi:hypothetical protein
MKKPVKKARRQSFFEGPLAARALNVLLFFAIFLLLYFVWVLSFPGVSGLPRLIPCWVLAYGFTWIVAYLTRGTTRFLVTLVFIALVIFVFTAQSSP